MRALLQRVAYARVRVSGEIVGEIGPGILALVGCCKEDGSEEALRLADRIAGYRIFPDAEGKTNWDLEQAGGAVLVVSQFTLAADTRKGRRPSFDPALDPQSAENLVRELVGRLRERGLQVAEGVFGAEMEVELLNRGPASYLLEVLPASVKP